MQNNTHKKTIPGNDLFFRFATFTIRLIFRINGGLDVKGTENIPPEGGIIIASNHISYLDPPLIGAVMPRRTSFMARRGLFTIPLISWVVKRYSIPVDREKALPSTIKQAVKRIKNSEIIIIFPEGRRSETGELQEGKQGLGLIAHLSKASIVPAVITGSDKALPFGARWLRRAKISITFGAPLDTSELNGEGDSLYGDITKKTMSKIGELKKHYANNSC